MEAAVGGHMDLKWWRALRVREEGVEEGECRTFDDPRNSLSHKGEPYTSDNNQHCYKDGRDHKQTTCRGRNLLF